MAFLIILSVAVLVLIVFIIRQNIKDKQKLTRQLNQDYPHRREDETDIETEEIRH